MILEEVLKETLNVKTIKWNIPITSAVRDFAYIDHQSASYEGMNLEMFESKEKLADFLFNSNSFIHTDNDNH